MDVLFLDDLHGLRRKTYRQLMQALAAQYCYGPLDQLEDDTINDLTREVESHVARFAAAVRAAPRELSPQSPFEYLIADLLALGDLITRAEREIAGSGHDQSSMVC